MGLARENAEVIRDVCALRDAEIPGLRDPDRVLAAMDRAASRPAFQFVGESGDQGDARLQGASRGRGTKALRLGRSADYADTLSRDARALARRRLATAEAASQRME